MKSLFLSLLLSLWLSAPFAPSLAAQIRIGLAAPLTGPDAGFGTELRDGAERAAAAINARGGVLGQKLVIVPADDKGELKQGIAVADRFVDEKMSLVIGHFSSSVTLAASEIYADHAILDITPTATNPQITERGLDLIFRTCGRDDQQTEVAADFLIAQGARKIAILFDNTAYDKGLADDLRARLQKHGIVDVVYAGVDKGEKDHARLVDRLKAGTPDFVYWSGDASDAGLILKEMRGRGVGARFIGTDSLATDEFTAAAGDAAEGALMTFPIDPQARPQAAAIIKELRARNVAPGPFTLYAYAAVQVLAEAAEAAGSVRPEAIAKALHSGRPFATVLGTLAYDAKGDITTPDYAIFVWKRGYTGQLEYEQAAR